MSEPLAQRTAGVALKKRLFLVFHIGDERFALPATDVVEVLPRLPLILRNILALHTTPALKILYAPRPFVSGHFSVFTG